MKKLLIAIMLIVATTMFANVVSLKSLINDDLGTYDTKTNIFKNITENRSIQFKFIHSIDRIYIFRNDVINVQLTVIESKDNKYVTLIFSGALLGTEVSVWESVTE